MTIPFTPREEDLKYFDPNLFKNKAEIKTLLAYYYSMKCDQLKLDLDFLKFARKDVLRPITYLCMSKYMLGSQPDCLQEWNQVDWITKKDFTARERKDLFKKLTTCQNLGITKDPVVSRDMQVTKHYYELLWEREGLSDKLLPYLYTNLSKVPQDLDITDISQNEFLQDGDKIIKDHGLERQAEISKYTRAIPKITLEHFPLRYTLFSHGSLGKFVMECIKSHSDIQRIHLLSHEEILERTNMGTALNCIALHEWDD